MRLIVAFLLLGCVDITWAHMMPFTTSEMGAFFNFSTNSDIDQICRDRLGRMSQFLLGNLSSVDFPPILSSFSIGRSDELLGETRWVILHNMLKCFLTNLEYNGTRSFCFGYNSQALGDLRAIGICIPRECANNKIELLEQWNLVTTKRPLVINQAVCIHSRHERPWYLGFAPLVQLIICLAFTTLITIGTKYHSKFEKSRLLSEQVLFAFSLKRNFIQINRFPKYPHSTITCMFGLRFISMFWTMIGHSFSWVQAYVENVEEFRHHMTDSFWNVLLTNFNLAVDTFFVLSATLTSYSWFRRHAKEKQTEKSPAWNSWRYWCSFYQHRLIRLWPAYLLALSLITFFFTELHSHPMWPPADPSVQCRKYGWQNILFMNSLMGNNCMGWTWYISTEFIYYLISPIFLLLLKSSPQMGFSLCLGTIIVSCSLKLNVMIKKNYPPIPLHFTTSKFFSGTFMEQVEDYYVKPQYRISPYIVGLLLGYQLASFQDSNRKVYHSLKLQYFGWFFCFIFGCWSLLGAYPTMKLNTFLAIKYYFPLFAFILGFLAADLDLPLTNLIYGSTHRVSWALSVAWIVYACHMGIGGFINTILSYKLFVPLSSLCYSVYLMHLLIVFGTFMWSPFPIVFSSKIPLLLLSVPQLLLSYMAAIMISMYAEFPALNLEKLFLHNIANKISEDGHKFCCAENVNNNDNNNFKDNNNKHIVERGKEQLIKDS